MSPTRLNGQYGFTVGYSMPNKNHTSRKYLISFSVAFFTKLLVTGRKKYTSSIMWI